jgi:hypothetical protein
MWLIMVVFSSLIFLNFIIAEVGNSYGKVRENISQLVYQERSGLINEVEDLYSWEKKDADKIKFPKYLIIRDVEE